MRNNIGNGRGIGGALRHALQGESFIRHIGNDKLIYNFKSGSGTTVKDRSREGNDGTFGAGAAAPTWKRNSLYFDGGDYVMVADSADIRIADGFSVVAMYKLADLNNMGILSKMPTAKNVGWSMRSKLIDIDAYEVFDTSDGGTRVTTQSDDTSVINMEYCIIGVHTTAKTRLYKNGKNQVDENTTTAVAGNEDLYIGRFYTDVDNYYLIGTMYSFRILNKCLSGIEAQQIYLSQKWRGNN